MLGGIKFPLYTILEYISDCTAQQRVSLGDIAYGPVCTRDSINKRNNLKFILSLGNHRNWAQTK